LLAAFGWAIHTYSPATRNQRRMRSRRERGRPKGVAAELREMIENAERKEHVTLSQLARYLNELWLGISFAHGKQRHANSVRRVRQRISIKRPTSVQLAN
jgi:hypothetical protein